MTVKKTILAAALVGAFALSIAAIASTHEMPLANLEAKPVQTTRRVFLRTGNAGWSNGAYMHSWGSADKTVEMTHVFDFASNDGLYFADIVISDVTGFLFLDGSAISGGVPNWSVTDASPWLKSPDAPALPGWGRSDAYVLTGDYGKTPTISGGKALSLTDDQAAQLLKRYTSCSSDSALYTGSCLAYPQLQADFNIELYLGNDTEVPMFAGGEKNGTTLGAKIAMMKHQCEHYDDNPYVEPDSPVVEKTEIEQTYADFIENNVYNLDGAPTEGTCKLLVIPVWLSDSPNYITTAKKATVRSDIEDAYFGSTSDTGWHSVKSYYEAESKGALSMSGVVSDWYAPGLSTATIGQYGSSETASLVKQAADWYFTNNPGEDRADYDCDDNGYLDGVMLIYGAPNYSDLGNDSYDNLWAYCYWAQDASKRSVSSPGVNVFFWASYDFMYGSNVSSSRTGKSGYYAGDTSHCAIDAHTYIHEMGHVFGLDDYYDYGSNGYTPAGSFSMQDYNVGGHDPFSTMAYGWSDPYIPTETCEITIGAFQTTHDVILLTPSWNAYDSPFDEYLLLELYTPTGLNAFDSTYQYGNYYPQGPSAVGIRLWHVDARLLYYTNSWTASINHLTTNALYESYYPGVEMAFTNTYDGSYATELGSSYYDYNLLQLIRNDAEETYRPTSSLSASDLFRDGDAFDMATYQSQFVKGTKLNSGSSLGWSFSVAVTSAGENSEATVSLVRA